MKFREILIITILAHVTNRMDDREEDEDCARSKPKENTPKNAVSKRPRGSPTMHTPHREQKRVSMQESMASNGTARGILEPIRLSMNDASGNVKEKWSNDELKALIEFILFHPSGEQWPSHKQAVFWNRAGEFVKERSGSSLSRSGMVWCVSCFSL